MPRNIEALTGSQFDSKQKGEQPPLPVGFRIPDFIHVSLWSSRAFNFLSQNTGATKIFRGEAPSPSFRTSPAKESQYLSPAKSSTNLMAQAGGDLDLQQDLVSSTVDIMLSPRSPTLLHLFSTHFHFTNGCTEFASNWAEADQLLRSILQSIRSTKMLPVDFTMPHCSSIWELKHGHTGVHGHAGVDGHAGLPSRLRG